MKNQFLAGLVIIFYCYYPQVFAQKQNNVWTFGNKTGIDFNGPVPVAITTSSYSFEACASICDASGNLLFYANDVFVWDKTHTLMPNGMGISIGSSGSSTQGVGIIPVPDEPNKYFLFTIEEEGGVSTSGRISYSIIDMSLNSGKGDVIAGKKNILLADSMSEKLAFAPSCDGIWVVTHHLDSPVFYAFKVYSSSSIATPVVSVTPGLVQKSNYTRGKAIFSSDYSKIAIGSYYLIEPGSSSKPSILELFDFDTKTGIVSGYYPIDTIGTTYGIEFSKNNTKLYVVSQADRKAYQYNLSLLPSLAAVRASKYSLGGIYIDARRGPDDKIYLNTADGTNIISRINNPDNAGAACNFQKTVAGLTCNGYFLNMGEKSLFFTRYTEDTLFSRTDSALCVGQSIAFTGDSTHHGFLWNDGDTSRNRTLNKEGTYLRQSLKLCTAYIDTIALHLNKTDITGYSRKDTIICFATQVTLTAPVSNDHYSWSDGSSGPENTFLTAGTKIVYTSSSSNPCSLRADTLSVSFINFSLALTDQAICKDQTLIMNAATSGASAYNWSNGSQKSSIQITDPGQYWVTVSVGLCKQTDTVLIRSEALMPDLGPDKQVCEGESVILRPAVENAAYSWQDGSSGNSFTVKENGMYIVAATRNGCTEKDSVQVSFIQCSDCIAIPNAFTPNKDGHNDVFGILCSCPVSQYKLMIMNRYGQQIFVTEDISKTWNGSFNGQLLDSGVYYYLLKIKFQYPGAKEQLYKGDLSLLR